MRKIRGVVNSYQFWLLVAILLLALGVRLWGVNHRLPYIGGGFADDERVYIDYAILVLRGDAAAVDLGIGTGLAYVFAALGQVVFFVTGADVHQTPTYQELTELHNVTVCCIGIPYSLPQLYLWLRIVTGIGGAISTVIVYFIGREVKSEKVGILAALFVAFLPLNVFHSHFATRTMPGLLTLLIAFYIILASYNRGRWLSLILFGGGATVIAVVIKQNNLILLAPLSVAILLSTWQAYKYQSGSKPIRIMGVLLAIVIFLLLIDRILEIFNVVNLLYDIYNRVFNNSYVYDTYVFSMGGQNGLEWLLDYTWYKSNAAFLLLLSVPGLLVALRLSDKRGLILLAVPVPYLVLMSFFIVRFEHWLVPPYTFMLILAALFLETLFFRLRQLMPGGSTRWPAIVVAVSGGLLISPAYHSFVSDYNLSLPDARDTAAVWLTQNLPPGSKVIIERYGPFLSQEKHRVVYVRSLVEEGIQQLESEKIDYIVGNSQNLSEFVLAREDPVVQQEVENQLLQVNMWLNQHSPEKIFVGPFDTIVHVYKIPR